MLANLLFFASIHVLVAPWPMYIESIGGLPRDVGLTTAAFSLTAVLARPVVGRLADRWGRRETLLVGLSLFTVVPLTYSVLRTVPALVIVRMVHGVGIAAFTTAYTVFTAEMVTAGRRGEALGLAGTAPSLSLMIWPPAGMPILERFGFQPLFLLAALLGGFGLLLGLALPSRSLATDDNPGLATEHMPFGSVLRQRSVWVPTLTMFALGVAFGSVFTFLPLFTEERGMGNAGLFFSAYALSYAVARVPAGRLSDRWGYRRVAIPALLLLALAFGLLAFAARLPVLLTEGVVLGVAMGSVRVVLDAMAVNESSPAARGTAVSVMYAGFDLGIGIGSVLLGLWAERVGYGGMFVTVGLVSLVGMLAFAILTRPVAVRRSA